MGQRHSSVSSVHGACEPGDQGGEGEGDGLLQNGNADEKASADEIRASRFVSIPNSAFQPFSVFSVFSVVKVGSDVADTANSAPELTFELFADEMKMNRLLKRSK